MHHDRYYLNQNFGDVLNKTVAFLRDNPGEVVYMRLKQEYSSVMTIHSTIFLIQDIYKIVVGEITFIMEMLIRLLERHEEKSSFL